MRDHFTGIDFSDPFMNYRLAKLKLVAEAIVVASPYRMLRAKHRHLYDGKKYAPASTHAEAMERYGFRVTSGGAR